MKRLLLLTATAVFSSAVMLGQNVITGGNMEDPGAWTLGEKGEPTDEATFTFNYEEDVPAAGSGGCLRIEGELDPQGSDAQIDAYCYQEVTLEAGTTYYFSGAFKDATEDGFYNFWCEVGLSLYDPVEYPDSIMFMVGFNAWEGCTGGIDGTFQDDYCKYDGPTFEVPAEPTGEQTYYFVILTGMWDNSENIGGFDVLLDELVLSDEEAPSSTEIYSIKDKLSLSGSPNPFSDITTVTYTIPKQGMVKLSIYNVLGEEIKVLTNGLKQKGTYTINLNASDLGKGVCYTVLQLDKIMTTHKFVVQ